MIDIDLTLAERGKTYGDFGMGTGTEAIIIDALMRNHMYAHGVDMPTLHKVWLSKLVMKLARLSVSPQHVDSYRDIAGYAILVEKELTKGDNNAKSE